MIYSRITTLRGERVQRRLRILPQDDLEHRIATQQRPLLQQLRALLVLPRLCRLSGLGYFRGGASWTNRQSSRFG